jgi:hypothetical protein
VRGTYLKNIIITTNFLTAARMQTLHGKKIIEQISCENVEEEVKRVVDSMCKVAALHLDALAARAAEGIG